MLNSPVASNEASAALPAGRPGGGVARDDDAMCWDEYLLWSDGKRAQACRARSGRPAINAVHGKAPTSTGQPRLAGRTTPKMRKALPVDRAAHRTSLGCAWDGFILRTGSALAGTCAIEATVWERHGKHGDAPCGAYCPAPRFRCSYPPAGHCKASVPGHHHVSSNQCGTAPTRIVAAVRRAVTAAGSDGPITGARHCSKPLLPRAGALIHHFHCVCRRLIGGCGRCRACHRS